VSDSSTGTPPGAPALTRFRALAYALDARFRVPGTAIRFGWDALIGLFPGVGDALGGLVGLYGLYVATRLGAPPVILARMFLTLLVDVVGGALPVLGDMFDIGWQANLRNVRLLERWVGTPATTRRRSWGLFMLLAAGLTGVIGAVLAALLVSFRALLGR
jgi:hypothetical protein